MVSSYPLTGHMFSFVKDLGVRAESGASQRLYRVEPALEGHDFVVVSAARIMGTPETYIFGADSEGEITNWSELGGSFRGGLDHEEALRRAGYEATVEPVTA